MNVPIENYEIISLFVNMSTVSEGLVGHAISFVTFRSLHFVRSFVTAVCYFRIYLHPIV